MQMEGRDFEVTLSSTGMLPLYLAISLIVSSLSLSRTTYERL